MDHQTVQELIPASLLGVLDATEQQALLDHVRQCAACRTEADSLRPAVSVLGLAAPDAGAPPPRVKQQMLAAVRSSAKPQPALRAKPRLTPTWRWAAILIPAALALILIAGLGVTTVSLQTQLTQQQARLDRLTRIQTALQQFLLTQNIQVVPVVLTDQAGAADAKLYIAGDQVAMSVTGLPLLADNGVYQCWWRDPQTGEVVAGVAFKVDADGAGVWVWPKPDGHEYDQMIITQESQPGHTQINGPVILTVNL